MKNNQLPVSRKFYNDITLRISQALSAAPASASEAMRIVDSYMAGEDPDSSDAMAMLAFNMIKAEIDRAMSRSQRARERAKARKDKGIITTHPKAEVVSDPTPEPDTEAAPKRPMSRRERRAALNLLRRLNKPRWGAIS